MLRVSVFCALALSGCTAITGAGDFKVDDTAFPRDLDYTFKAMAPHATMPMEVAVVDGSGFVQARARIYLPPRPSAGEYPDGPLKMERALWKGAYDLYFFIDGNPTNYLLDTVDAARTKVKDDEHPWIEPVPASGLGSFTHSTNFRIFDTADLKTLGKSVILKAPSFDNLSGPVRACLAGLVSQAVGDEVEVRVLLHEADGTRRQMGMFRTYKGVELPSEVQIQGIIDVGSTYTVEVIRDGASESQDFDATDDITIEVQAWLGVGAAAIRKCNQP